MKNKNLQFFKPDYTLDEQVLAMVEVQCWTVLNRPDVYVPLDFGQH
jgi:hypothetical protein